MVTVGLTQPILAQVVFGGSFSSFLGIALAGSGIALFALRSMRPRLARDIDIVFASVALLCGGILVFQGWRQDPILQFGQFLLTASAIYFAVENIRLRGVTTEQAKRSAPIVDDERPVSRVYRAELDELNPYEERPATRRIRGSRDTRRDEIDDERPRRSRTGEGRLESSDRSRRRSGRDDSGFNDYSGFSDSDDYSLRDDRDRRSRSDARSGSSPGNGPRSRRPRPMDDDVAAPRRDRQRERPSDIGTPSEYVDYRPIDNDDNWGDY